MTGQGEAKVPNGDVSSLVYAYQEVLEIWKVHNDNYFKRVQIFMGVLQVGLLLAAIRALEAKQESPVHAMIPIFIGILGFLAAVTWVHLNTKQVQYLEFCRRILRNLERRFAHLGVPLEYFVLEALIFGPDREVNDPLSSATQVGVKEGRQHMRLLEFAWSKETYPVAGESKRHAYSVSKVRGGMAKYERSIAVGAIVAWCIVIALAMFAGRSQLVSLGK